MYQPVRRASGIVPFLLFVVVLVVTAPAAAGDSPRLVHPPDKVAVAQDRLQLVGLADSGPVRLTVRHGEDSRTVTAEVSQGAFQLVVELAAGTTTVEMNGQVVRTIARVAAGEPAPAGFRPLFVHSKGNLTTQCDGCHLIVLRQKPDYRHIRQKVSCITADCHADKKGKTFAHGPVKQGNCDGCHNPHGTVNPSFLKARNAALCYRCHVTEEKTFAKGVVHFPVAKGECLSCHDPHQSDFEFHLKRGNIRELCAACHGYERLRHKYMHEPVESEDCIACHAPHASPNRRLLMEKGNAMCFTCHEVRKEEFRARHVHEPVQKDCTLCHDPHGSELPDHLRTEMDAKGRYIVPDKPFQAVCLRCHAKLDPWLVQTLDQAKVRHKPVDEGKCTVCHTPHSTDFPKQLRAKASDLCFSCHKKMGEKIKGAVYRHGPIRAGECFQCHLVHGSNHRHLLRDYFTDKFYAPFDPKNFKLCSDCHNPRVITEKISTETGFRNGTTNLHYVHVHRADKGRTCITCHEVHGSDQPNHIRRKIPYRRRYSINLDYTATETGGGCVVGCHKPRRYDRAKPVVNQ